MTQVFSFHAGFEIQLDCAEVAANLMAIERSMDDVRGRPRPAGKASLPGDRQQARPKDRPMTYKIFKSS